jgi:hypothetical protein
VEWKLAHPSDPERYGDLVNMCQRKLASIIEKLFLYAVRASIVAMKWCGKHD